MELISFTEREFEEAHFLPSIKHMPQFMLKGKMAVKDGSLLLPGFFFFFPFLFLDLVREEPTETTLVCVDLYSLELTSFLIFNTET